LREHLRVFFIVSLVGGVLGSLAYWVREAPLNIDEGIYLGAPWLFWQGLRPYVDFAFTQGPILPLFNAPLVGLLGPSLETGRWISAGWTAAGLGVAFVMMRHGRSLFSTVWLALLLTTPSAMAGLCIGKTYALAQVFLMLAASSMLLPWVWWQRLLWLSTFSVLACGTRLTLAPVIGLLWLAFWWRHRKEGAWHWFFLFPALMSAVFLGPFAFPDLARFWFWTVHYHQQTIAVRHADGFWVEQLRFAPGAIGALVVALCFARRAWSKDADAVLLLGATAVGTLISLCVVGLYAEYITPFLLLLLVASSRVLSAAGVSSLLSGGLCMALLVLNFTWAECPPLLKRTSLPFIEQAHRAADFLRAHTRPSDEVLASTNEIVVEAGRIPFRNMIAGPFSVTMEYPDSTATSLGLVPYGEMLRDLKRGIFPAVVLTAYDNWNFAWSIPSLGPAEQAKLYAILRDNYVLSFTNETYRVYLPVQKDVRISGQAAVAF
jgi:MFS family permease